MATRTSPVKRPAPTPPDIRKTVYGWLPDIPDNRDHLYGAVRKIPKTLPAKVDLRPLCSPVEDQQDLGSCTANSLAGALEFLMRKDRVTFADMSRLFIYYNERVIEHTVKTDAGAMIRDGIKTLAKQGACTEKNWPYDIARFAIKPTKACYTEALNYQILTYARLNTLDEMRACLAEGFPFVFGFSVFRINRYGNARLEPRSSAENAQLRASKTPPGWRIIPISVEIKITALSHGGRL